jgi:hypothetical protein
MKKIFTLVAFTCFGVMMASAGAPVTGLEFNGDAESHIDVGDATLSETFTAPSELTVEAWVNYTTNDGGYILCNEEHVGVQKGWVLRLENRKIDFTVGAGAEGASNWFHCMNVSEPEADTWYHVAAVYTPTQTQLYIDGDLVATCDLPAPMNQTSKALVLGEGTAWTGRMIRGKLADVRIWSIARTQQQISENRGTFLKGNESGLVANWKMNAGTGDLVADATGSFDLARPEQVAWFGVINGVKKAATTGIEVLAKDKSLSVVNNSASDFSFSVVTLAGSKVLEASVKAGETFAQAAGLSGAYILKGTDETGATLVKKVIL